MLVTWAGCLSPESLSLLLVACLALLTAGTVTSSSSSCVTAGKTRT
jgi:hypothetical protein